MKGNKGIGSIFPILLIAIAVLSLIRLIFGGEGTLLGSIIKIGFIVILVLIALAIVVFLIAMFSSDRGTRNGEKTVTDKNKNILANAHASVTKLRRKIVRIKDTDVRSKANSVCGTADKILQTLREKQEQIPDVRQFLNYYIPTFDNIIDKFGTLEANEQASEEMTAKVKKYLDDIGVAMNKQYSNLFEADKLDLTVDMEAMTIACKRDGLIEDGVSVTSESGDQINLTL